MSYSQTLIPPSLPRENRLRQGIQSCHTPSHTRSHAIKRCLTSLALQLLPVTSPTILTRASVMIVPEADHVNTSICPGVSIKTYLCQERPLKKYYTCATLKDSPTHKTLRIWLSGTGITSSHCQV